MSRPPVPPATPEPALTPDAAAPDWDATLASPASVALIDQLLARAREELGPEAFDPPPPPAA